MPPSTTTDDDAIVRVPRIVVAVRHPTKRRYLCDLIEQGCHCWLATTSTDPEKLRDIVSRLDPDAIVLETSRFPDYWADIADTFPVAHVLVIGPHADEVYRDAALTAGAGAWIPGDRLPTDLVHELQRVVKRAGCTCGCAARPTPTEQVTP